MSVFANEFFKPDYVKEVNYFDEGPKFNGRLNITHVNTSSINTTLVDSYRQGVEITQLKHFDAGLAKIHAGEPGHVLRKNAYGMDRHTMMQDAFQEIDYFDPVKFLEAQSTNSPLLSNIITFPIITGDNDQIENYYFDGSVEPFPIREVIAFFSIDVPFKPRGIKGMLMAGNSDSALRSDRVMTVDYIEQSKHQIPFLDLVDLFNDTPLNGYFTFDASSFEPFEDARYIRNTYGENIYDDALISVLSPMTGSTDNYISFKQKSATTGWVYDSISGTDSLAFGGMIY